MGKTRKIILFADSSRAAGAGLLKGVGQYSAIHGPWIFFRNPPFYYQSDKKGKMMNFKGLVPDGVITEQIEMDAILKLGVPTIAAPYNQKSIANLPVIAWKNEHIGELAAEHFLSKGFKIFAFCGFKDMFWSDERFAGYKKRLMHAGFKAYENLTENSNSLKFLENQQKKIVEWLKTLPKPVAILACNDEHGFQVIESCRTAKFSVPEEVAVLGIDNDELVCNLCNPPMSSVSLGFERAGYEAAAFLEKLMDGEKMKGQKITLDTSLIVTRQSTDTLAISDVEVANAIKFIRQNAHLPLQVTDVMNVLSTSRRGFEMRFKKLLGRTIYSEISRVRSEYIAKMLVETDMSLKEIAKKLNFEDAGHFSRYFRHVKGMSPYQFRKKYE